MGDYISAFTHYVGGRQHVSYTRDFGVVSFVLVVPIQSFCFIDKHCYMNRLRDWGGLNSIN
jgi:hypothetical protein